MKLKNYENKILEIIKPILDENNFNLYELNFINEYDNDVLQILVENKDKDIKIVDFDNLILVNESISKELDEFKELSNAYVLEVSSAGVERQIKEKLDLEKSIGNYLYVKTNLKIENIEEADFYGELKSCENDQFFFTFFLKGKPKKLKIKWDEITFVRHAVKF